MSSGFRDRGFGPQGPRYDGPPKDNPNNNRQQHQRGGHNFLGPYNTPRRNDRPPPGPMWPNPNVNNFYNPIQHPAPPPWQQRLRFPPNPRPEFRGNVNNFQPRGPFPRFNRFPNPDAERNFQPGGNRRDFMPRYPPRPLEKKIPPPPPPPPEIPAPPLLGSEEERRQKISNAVDELKKKLFTGGPSASDDAKFWEDDFNIPEPQPEPSNEVIKPLPELIHGPPEISLTINDFKDIGRLDGDSNKLHKVTKAENVIQIVEVAKAKIDVVDGDTSLIQPADHQIELADQTTSECPQTEESKDITKEASSAEVVAEEKTQKDEINTTHETKESDIEATAKTAATDEFPENNEVHQEKKQEVEVAKSSIVVSPKVDLPSTEAMQVTPKGRRKKIPFGWPIEETSPIISRRNALLVKTYTPPPPLENPPRSDPPWQPAPAFDPRKPSTGDVTPMVNDFNTMCPAYPIPIVTPFGLNTGLNTGFVPPYPPPISYPQNLRPPSPDLNEIPIPAEPTANEDEAFSELRKAMEFANELMSIDPEEQDFAGKCADGFENFPTLPDLPPPLPPPPPEGETTPKTPKSKKKKKKKKQDLVATVPLPPDSYVQPDETRSIEEPARPKVVFNLPMQSRKLSTIAEWSADENVTQRTRLKLSKLSEDVEKPKETKSSAHGMDFPSSIKLDLPSSPSVSQPETIQMRKKTGEPNWKDKVIGRFLKMSKNDIKNMINNSNLKKFDIALQQLVKEQKSSLNLMMRNTEDEKIKNNINNHNKDENFIHQLQAILDPAATVDIADLPTNFIHQLNEVLKLDVRPDLTRSTLTNPTNTSDRSAVSVSPQHGINAPAVSTSNTTFKSSYASKIDNRTTKDSGKSIEPTTINIRKKPAICDSIINPANLSVDNDQSSVQRVVSNPAIIMEELDDLFSAGINRVKMTKNLASRQTSFTNQSNIVTGGETPIVDRVDRIFTAGIERAKAATLKSDDLRCRGRKNSADVDVFRNLTKEEYDARYGIEATSSHDNPYRIMNPKHLRTKVDLLNGDQISRQVISPGRFALNSDEGSHSECHSDNSSSSASSSDSSGEPSIDVSKMLRFIKEREKMAKKKSINEEIRDEVAAEIERKRKEKRAHKEHRKLKKKDRKKKDKREKRKRSRKKKRRHFSEGDARSSCERSPLLSESQIKKEPEAQSAEPPALPQKKRIVGPRSVMMKAGLMPSDDNKKSPRQSPSHSSPNSQSSNHSTTYLKTKAQLKQMPDVAVKRTSVRPSAERLEAAPRVEQPISVFDRLDVKIKEEPISPPVSPQRHIVKVRKKVKEFPKPVAESSKLPFKPILERNKAMEAKAMQFSSSSDENSAEKQTVLPVFSATSSANSPTLSSPSSFTGSLPLEIPKNSLGSKKLDIKTYKERTLQSKVRTSRKLTSPPPKSESLVDKSVVHEKKTRTHSQKSTVLSDKARTVVSNVKINITRHVEDAKESADVSAVSVPVVQGRSNDAEPVKSREKITEGSKCLAQVRSNDAESVRPREKIADNAKCQVRSNDPQPLNPRKKDVESSKNPAEVQKNSDLDRKVKGKLKRKRSRWGDLESDISNDVSATPTTSSLPGPLSSKRRRASLEATQQDAISTLSSEVPEQSQGKKIVSKTNENQEHELRKKRFGYLFKVNWQLKSDGFPDLVPLERLPQANSPRIPADLDDATATRSDIGTNENHSDTSNKDGKLPKIDDSSATEMPKNEENTSSVTEGTGEDDPVNKSSKEHSGTASAPSTEPNDEVIVPNDDLKRHSAVTVEESVPAEDTPAVPAIPEALTVAEIPNLSEENQINAVSVLEIPSAQQATENFSEVTTDKTAEELPQEASYVTDFSERLSKHWRSTSIDNDRLSPEDMVQKEDDQEAPNWQLEAEISSQVQRKNVVLHDRALISDTPRNSFLDDPIAFATSNNSPSNEPNDEYGILEVNEAGSIYVNQLGDNSEIDMINDVPTRESYTPEIVSALESDLVDQVAMTDKDLMGVGNKASADRLPSPILQEGINEEESNKLHSKCEEKIEKSHDNIEKIAESEKQIDKLDANIEKSPEKIEKPGENEKLKDNVEKSPENDMKSQINSEKIDKLVDQEDPLVEKSADTTNNGALQPEKNIDSTSETIQVPEISLNPDELVENNEKSEVPQVPPLLNQASLVPELQQVERNIEEKKLDDGSLKLLENQQELAKKSPIKETIASAEVPFEKLEEKEKSTSDINIKKTLSTPVDEKSKEREKSVESSSSRHSRKHSKESDSSKKLNSSSLTIKEHKKHKHYHEKSTKKSKITEKTVIESVKSNLVILKPTTKNAVMSRMQEIDLAIQNLMNEKMTLYQMLQDDEWPIGQLESAIENPPMVTQKSTSKKNSSEAINLPEKMASKKSTKAAMSRLPDNLESKSTETSKVMESASSKSTIVDQSPSDITKSVKSSSWEDKVPHKSAKKRQHKDENNSSKAKELRKEGSIDANIKIADALPKKRKKSAKNAEGIVPKKSGKLSQVTNRKVKSKLSQGIVKSIAEEKERDFSQKIAEKTMVKSKNFTSTSEITSEKMNIETNERKTEEKKKKSGHTTLEQQQSLLYSDDSTLDSLDRSVDKKVTGLVLLEESMKREVSLKKQKELSKKSKESTPDVDDEIQLPKAIIKKKQVQKNVQAKKSAVEGPVEEKLSSKVSKKSGGEKMTNVDEKIVEKSEEPMKKSLSIESEKFIGETKIMKKAGSKLSIVDTDSDSDERKLIEKPKPAELEAEKPEKKPSDGFAEVEKEKETKGIIKKSIALTKAELLNDWSDSSSSISSTATKLAKRVQRPGKKAPISKSHITDCDSGDEKPPSEVEKSLKPKANEVKPSKIDKPVKTPKAQNDKSKASNEKAKVSLKHADKKSEKTKSAKELEKAKLAKSLNRDDESTVEGDDEDDDTSLRKRGRPKRNNKKTANRRSNKAIPRSQSRAMQSSSRESSLELERSKKRPRSGSPASSVNSRKRSAAGKSKATKSNIVERSREDMTNCRVNLVDCKYLFDLKSEALFKGFGISINSWHPPKCLVLSDEKSRSEDEAMIVIEADSNVGSSSAVELIETGIEDNEDCLGYGSSPRIEQLAKEKKEIDVELIDIKDEPILEATEEKVESPTIKADEDDAAEVPDDDTDDVDKRKMRYTVHKGPILDIKVFGDSFLAASEDGSIYRYSQKSNGILNIYQSHEAAVTCLYVHQMPGMESESKKWFLFSGSLDASLRCYDVMEGALSRPIVTVGSPIQCMDQAWGSIFIGTKSGHISRYDIKSGTLREDKLDFSDKPVLALRASTEGPRKVLIVASRNQPITIRDAQNGLFLRTIAGQRTHTVYSLLRDRNYVYCGTSSTCIPVFDFISGDQISQYNAGVGIVCMQLYRQLLFAGCYDGNIYVFDTEDKKLICSIPGPGNMLLSMEVVDETIIAGSKDRRLHAWRMPTQVRTILLDRT